MSLPRALAGSSARLGIVVLAALTALAASINVAAVASAHVSVSSQDAAPGGYGKLTFRVPNESDTASTVGLRIQIPEEAAMASVRTQAVPGWTATLTTSDLATPLKSHGQEISSYVSVVEFRATEGGIAPGQFQEFALSGGPFPEADALSFPTVQPTATAASRPGSSRGSRERRSRSARRPRCPWSPRRPRLRPLRRRRADDHTHAAASDSPAGLALFLSILALLVAIGGAVLGRRATRRTVSA